MPAGFNGKSIEGELKEGCATRYLMNMIKELALSLMEMAGVLDEAKMIRLSDHLPLIAECHTNDK